VRELVRKNHLPVELIVVTVDDGDAAAPAAVVGSDRVDHILSPRFLEALGYGRDESHQSKAACVCVLTGEVFQVEAGPNLLCMLID
jgi:hypothetical protein